MREQGARCRYQPAWNALDYGISTRIHPYNKPTPSGIEIVATVPGYGLFVVVILRSRQKVNVGDGYRELIFTTSLGIESVSLV